MSSIGRKHMQSRPRKAAKEILGTELLRKVLQTKAIFLGFSGFIFIFRGRSLVALAVPLPREQAADQSISIAILAIGLFLVLLSACLFWISSRKQFRMWQAFVMAALDVAWLLASVVAVALPLLPLTSGGRGLIAGIALVVAAFIALQLCALDDMLVSPEQPKEEGNDYTAA